MKLMKQIVLFNFLLIAIFGMPSVKTMQRSKRVATVIGGRLSQLYSPSIKKWKAIKPSLSIFRRGLSSSVSGVTGTIDPKTRSVKSVRYPYLLNVDPFDAKRLLDKLLPIISDADNIKDFETISEIERLLGEAERKHLNHTLWRLLAVRPDQLLHEPKVLAEMEILLKAGASPDVRVGVPLLTEAINARSIKAASLLLKYKADPLLQSSVSSYWDIPLIAAIHKYLSRKSEDKIFLPLILNHIQYASQEIFEEAVHEARHNEEAKVMLEAWRQKNNLEEQWTLEKLALEEKKEFDTESNQQSTEQKIQEAQIVQEKKD